MNRYRLVIAALVVVGCQEPSGLPDAVAVEASHGLFAGPGSEVEVGSPGALRARQTTGSTVVVEDAAYPGATARIPSSLRLNLFADAIYEAALVGSTRQGESVVWRGVVVGEPDSEVALAFGRGLVSGRVRVAERVFTIEPRSDGPIVIEWDEPAVPGDAPPVVPEPQSPRPVSDRVPLPAPDGVAEIDLLVVYTSAARDAAGGEAAMRTTLDLAVSEANASYESSGVAMRIGLVGVVETSYDEEGFDFYDALGRLATPGDGSMDEVPALRDELGADQVVMIVEHAGPYAGLGYQMTEANQILFQSFAYSVVSRAYATGFYTFAHELGHNQGANHDPANSDDGFYADSHGHQVPDPGYRTIMSYACASGSCPRVGLWSNPSLSFQARPTGVVGVSDNARTLNHTGAIAAAFRPRAVAPTPVAARLESPADGSTLPAGPVTFRWSNVGADEYYLFITGRPGGRPIYGASAGARTSVEVSGLPEGGEALFVRVWTRHGSDYLFSDHQVTAHRGAPRGARLSFPDTELTGPWSFFGWAAIEGASGYRLEVGTSADPTAYHVSEGPATFAFVPVLPTDGTTVVVRLHTLGAAPWPVEVSSLRAWTAPPYAASIISPVSGSRLERRRATFRWTATSADQHWLVVQDCDGILATVPATGDRASVSGLPADGRPLWVALYSHGPTGWAATSARYLSTQR